MEEQLSMILIIFGSCLGGIMICLCCLRIALAESRRKGAVGGDPHRTVCPYRPVIEVGLDI